MISILSARRLFLQWLEENDPVAFLKGHGVIGDGSLDLYHCISIDTKNGNVFYRQTPEPDDNWLLVDVVCIHDGDTFEKSGIQELTTEDHLQSIADHYEWFSEKILTEMSALNIDPSEIFAMEKMGRMSCFGFHFRRHYQRYENPDNIKFDFPKGTYGRMKK
jgi:hypothetical protein